MVVLVNNMPKTEVMGRVTLQHASYSDDVIAVLAIAIENAKLHIPDWTLAGYTWEIPDEPKSGGIVVAAIKQNILQSYWDPPVPVIDTRNRRNLNEASQNILGQTVEPNDPIFQGLREKRF